MRKYWDKLLTLFLVSLFIMPAWKFFRWLVIDSVVFGTADTCRESSGACIAFVTEKFKFIIFGFYPSGEIYREVIALIIFFFMLWHSKNIANWNKRLIFKWFNSSIIIFLLIRGGYLGLPLVESSKWGGLPLTLMLAIVGIAFSYPLGILLALGRRSKLALIRVFSTSYIELVRGVPLISILFMSSVMIPLFLPEGVSLTKLFRAQLAIILFEAAYLAEVVRGGLQSIPITQEEAADSLGLTYFQKMRLVILPQGLRAVVPSTINSFISLFKDTSLVIIISLFDLMSTTKSSISDSDWLGFSMEAYLFVACIYFIFCFLMSRFGKIFEQEFSKGKR
jgi:general L-amino acid transport system permease protein